MKFSTSPRERRTVIIGACLITVFLTLSKLLPTWHAWDRDVLASALEVRSEVTSTRSALALLPDALDTLEARKERLEALAPTLIHARTASGAAAALGALISGAAAQENVTVNAIQLRPDTTREGVFLRVRVAFDATGDLPGLVGLLLKIESAPQKIQVRSFNITQPQPGGSSHDPETLRLELVAEALSVLTSETAAAEAAS